MEDPIEDLELEDLKRKMNDGVEDTWVNVTTGTISKYLNEKLLEELEELDGLLQNPSNTDIQRIIDTRILRLAERLNRVDF